MPEIESTKPEPKPLKIVGIYLTELGHVMAKVMLSNGCYLNHPIAKIEDLLPEELSGVHIDIGDWRFIPCCE